jgi:hypothetical protein
MAPAKQRCEFHEARPAFARCMSCAKMLCQECATQWDGIWHCAACLAAKRAATTQRSPVFSWLAVLTTSLVLLYLGARVMVWTGAILAGLF